MSRAKRPTFSLVLETYNLGEVRLERFEAALESLGRQSLPVSEAQQLIVVDTGELPEVELTELIERQGWSPLYERVEGTNYEGTKQVGLDLAESEIVVFADADCIYGERWLESILRPFGAHRQDVLVVAGETSTEITGPYSLGVAATFHFERFSNETDLQAAPIYQFNNVAFRRSVFEECPLSDLPTERGAGFLHTLALRKSGITIWRQPGAKAFHPIPSPLSLAPEYVGFGMDSGAVAASLGDWRGSFRTPSRFQKVVRKLREALAEDRTRTWYLPLALPISGATILLYALGRSAAWCRWRFYGLPKAHRLGR